VSRFTTDVVVHASIETRMEFDSGSYAGANEMRAGKGEGALHRAIYAFP
jgi:hypothetical protein